MSFRLCAICQPKAETYVKAFEEMACRLDGYKNYEQTLDDAEKLVREFDAMLCAECRKLGPRLPGPNEWPFGGS